MRHLSIPVLLGLAVCGTAHAQRLAAYDPTAAAVAELQPSTPILPGPLPPVAGYPEAAAMPPLPMPAGDSTFDNLLGYHWFTNGMFMAAQPTPAFPPAVPPPPPFPIPAGILAAIGGAPVTGIALDAAAGVMWLVGMPGIVIGVAPVPAMPVVVPAFPMLFAFGAPISGLEWDAATGSLFAVDLAGFTYNFAPGGAPLAPPLPPPFAAMPPATDVAIDRTLALNAFGLRSLYVLAGPTYIDVHDPAPLLQPAGPPMGQGLAFLNHPAANPPVGTCACPGTFTPTQFTTSAMTSGNLAFGIGMGALPPFWPVLWAFDIAVFNPAFPTINGPGCPLGLFPGSATLITGGATADAAGTAILPLALTPPTLPLGFGPFYGQTVAYCPADPVFGILFAPMQQLFVAGL